MRLRYRLLALVSGTLTLAVGLTTWTVSAHARRTFEAVDAQRTAAIIAAFRREFAHESDGVTRAVERLVSSETLERMAIDLGGADPDVAPYVNEAAALATAYGLDFLEIVTPGGTIVSSAQWPARFGYTHTWVTRAGSDEGGPAFLEAVELPEGRALGLFAVAATRAADRRLLVAGGRRVDRALLASLDLPDGMRALLYRNLEAGFWPEQLMDTNGQVADARRLEPLISRVRWSGREQTETLEWPDGRETFQAIPLAGRGQLVPGVLLVGTSGRHLAALIGGIRRAGLLFGAVALALGIALSWIAAARITRPIERLAEGARQVAGGEWDVTIEAPARGDVAELVEAFTSMTRQLVDQRDRLVQSERVAAWREIARRLAHELKNPLFPLRITVENLQRAKAQAPEQFDEVFEESARTLLAELGHLNAIIGRFGDFARMPPPHVEPVRLNALVGDTVKLFDAQLRDPGRPAIVLRQDLDDQVTTVPADPEQVGRALRNLLLNAIDAMPAGGTITVRTHAKSSSVCLEVRDTGEGLAPEEASRLFTPYYTTRAHGTGLGLAIVQAVVSDHNGKISVESARGRGTTFRIELPA